MKKAVKIVLVFFIIFSINLANFIVKNKVEAAAEPVQFVFRTDKAKYNVGDTVTVICAIKNGVANGFLGLDGTVTYDSNMVKYESCKSLLSSDEWTLKYNNSTKKMLIGYDAEGNGLTKDGDIFQMKFIALKEGNFNVSISDLSLDANETKYNVTAASSIIVSKENTNTNTDVNNNTSTNTDVNNNTSTNTDVNNNTSTNTDVNNNISTNTDVNNEINNNVNENTNENTNTSNSVGSDVNPIKKDNTVANKIIPQTGVSTKVLIVVLIVAIIGAVAGFFYDRYKNIK